MKLSRLSLFSVVILALIAAAPRGSDRFIGTWDVELQPEDGSKPVKAVVTFKEGDVFTVTGPKMNFKPARYEVDTRGVQTNAFTATVEGPAKEKMEWTGMSGAGGEIRGDAKWTQSNGQVKSYTYSGQKRVK